MARPRRKSPPAGPNRLLPFLPSPPPAPPRPTPRAGAPRAGGVGAGARVRSRAKHVCARAYELYARAPTLARKCKQARKQGAQVHTKARSRTRTRRLHPITGTIPVSPTHTRAHECAQTCARCLARAHALSRIGAGARTSMHTRKFVLARASRFPSCVGLHTRDAKEPKRLARPGPTGWIRLSPPASRRCVGVHAHAKTSRQFQKWPKKRATPNSMRAEKGGIYRRVLG